MSDNKDAGGFLDSLFDAADKVVGTAEKVFAKPGGLWVVDEVIEEDGTHVWEVSGRGLGKLYSQDRQLAEQVCNLLNRGG